MADQNRDFDPMKRDQSHGSQGNQGNQGNPGIPNR